MEHVDEGGLSKSTGTAEDNGVVAFKFRDVGRLVAVENFSQSPVSKVSDSVTHVGESLIFIQKLRRAKSQWVHRGNERTIE